MKIEYDADLYKKIASLNFNKIIQVRNRKGIERTIHIQNITRLSWHELQLLITEGKDTFSKMVLLFHKYISLDSSEEFQLRGKNLTSKESEEIIEYIKIYRKNSFSRHFEVNEYITENDLWDNFSTIRSLNNHGDYKEIKGIQPKYFEMICQILNISGEGGLPLDAYKKY